MRQLSIICILCLLSACAAVKPEDHAKEVQQIIALSKNSDIFDTRTKLLIQAFREIESRVRTIEGKLKIPSPVIPTPVPAPSASDSVLTSKK